MKRYKFREKVMAMQFNENNPQESALVKLGKPDIHDRFDDTPEGWYVECNGGRYISSLAIVKTKLHHGNWIVVRENERVNVYTNEEFLEKFKPCKDDRP